MKNKRSQLSIYPAIFSKKTAKRPKATSGGWAAITSTTFHSGRAAEHAAAADCAVADRPRHGREHKGRGR